MTIKVPNGEILPVDVIDCAVTVPKIATGEIKYTQYKQPAKARNGFLDSHVRAQLLEPERYTEIEKATAQARWKIESKPINLRTEKIPLVKKKIFLLIFLFLTFLNLPVYGQSYIKNWLIESEIDLLDDSTDVVATTFPKDLISAIAYAGKISLGISGNEDDILERMTAYPIYDREGFKNNLLSAELLLRQRCLNNEFELLVITESQLAQDGDMVLVGTRIGKAEPKFEHWYRSTNGKAAFHPEPVKFINQLIHFETEKLVIRVELSSGSELTKEFGLSGIRAVNKMVAQACGFSLR